MVIITAGMIGVGKTTLTGKIAAHLGTKAFFEPVGDNPVLPLYYSNPKQYGFLLQIYFLNKRFSMIKKALSDDNNVLDRSIYEDALFTRENNADGNISDTELSVYLKLLDNMMTELNQLPKKAPDLLVYADSDFDTIKYRIKKRGRDYEQFDNNPGLENYYYKMWKAYQKWFDDYSVSPKIKIDLQQHDLSYQKNIDFVLGMIDDELAKIRQPQREAM
ncbi:MAG: deoxynucleoside kinase [Lentilactobacillus hilgardii]|jgi:deoxyadenosine/deoxycytidine kinase|uniref:Deoxynucleoside kinase n=1 Tax=Lentilactobacillus hilgardii TaxID=1588 RepID=A0A6P1E946_LENHI|nr:deoxynucleoside kinase [Lentilactobacillus hilgardii]MCI1923258.1 deoxynucleoside kinase [Lentilactobacillus buchneri]RRG09360.1 MAG: deoxynucleoside kinase [Lactobacillus sp.]EEI70299.1 deoxynucleoside kinase [Lentilactobacillus hilgardii ATCC 27305]MBZ2202304.1 deoxynucleoside kinase [Lentilactobacillus hilgardii]MBZ2205312.1 deoxynucleoside kinase [Lentilactobacillus hilgardii]